MAQNNGAENADQDENEAAAQRAQIRSLRRRALRALGYKDEIPEEALSEDFWQELYDHVKTKEMAGEAPLSTIVERAQAEAEQVPQGERHPLPDTAVEVGRIAFVAAAVSDTLAELHEQVPTLTVTEVETVVGGMRALIQQGNRLAWQVALHAVEQGLMSQADAAKLLGASTATISRRFHEGIDEAEEQKMARTDVRTNPVK